MTNVVRPIKGFQFTESNILKAKAFYALWLIEAMYHELWIVDCNGDPLNEDSLTGHYSLPWIVKKPINETEHYKFKQAEFKENVEHD